ncbi:MAG TPA: methylated-DNA--[protein]-cysteine S-methyltransferase [Burkholderiales bacterium]|nr:methylated-DNA--[protein]-cysteine S-methyltransferase [Burkholderiales bacterium]
MFTDGPLRRRPPEKIRYGTGKCRLGALLVASSPKGIVSIIVRGEGVRLVEELRRRFPKAELVRDEKGERVVVAKVARYIALPLGRFALPLDLRGTELQKRVWNEVRGIPFGETSTYTAIAAAIGAPRAIRAVAASCSRSWLAFAVPCHRVLHKGAEDAARRQRKGGVQYRWADYEARLAARRR